MMLGTHAALPVIGVTALDIYRLFNNQERLLTNWQLFFIGVGGILPDLLWPHFSMQGRLTSYTHTMWFLFLIIPITYYIANKTYKKNVPVFTCFFVLAVALHLAIDAISGGISLFYPIKAIWGFSIVPFRLWITADIVLLSIMVTLNFVRYRIGLMKPVCIKSKE